MRNTLLPFCLCLLLAGCTRLGTNLQHQALPPGTPPVETILSSLAANDAAIHNFKAAGAFTLKSPELAATQLLRESSIQFRRPNDLYVVGRKYATTVFRLTCIGPAFLIEFPTEKQYYFSPKGEHIEGISKTVSPSDIAQEMLLPEDWTELSARHVRILEYNETKQTAVLEIRTGALRKRPHRRLLVEGVPWVIRRSELFDKSGNILAVTNKDDYHEMDGIRFPAKVECTFPGQEAFMRFDMRKVFLNTELDDASFRIEAHAAELRDKGYQKMEPQPEP